MNKIFLLFIILIVIIVLQKFVREDFIPYQTYPKTIILYLIASYGGYLRIKFNCHTQLQVFIGGIIGIILGYIFYKLMLISNII